ncbi:hypothetical protein AHAS_Ahas11G0242800 [Arachis hypogaea]
MDPPSMLYSQLKAVEPFFLLADPNVIESEEHIMKMANHTNTITSRVGIPLVFKSSFVKANRTSSKSFCGLGMVEVLKILEKVKVAYDRPIVTDVHDSIQTDLLVVAAKTGKIVHIKKGQFCAPSMGILSCYVMANSAEKVRLAGNPNVMLDGEGVASGGLRELIPCIVRTAVAIGVDGIFMEVHDDPLSAPIDGSTQWPLRHLEELLEELIAIADLGFGFRAYGSGIRILHCELGLELK